jgi:uncharacterized protein HemY
MRGHWDDCEDLYTRALAAKSAIVDPVGEGNTLMNLGRLYERRGEWTKAEHCYERSLTIFLASRNPFGEGSSRGGEVLNNLGALYSRQSRWQESEVVHQRSLLFRREVGDRVGEARTLFGLGFLHHRWGKLAEAQDY